MLATKLTTKFDSPRTRGRRKELDKLSSDIHSKSPQRKSKTIIFYGFMCIDVAYMCVSALWAYGAIGDQKRLLDPWDHNSR